MNNVFISFLILIGSLIILASCENNEEIKKEEHIIPYGQFTDIRDGKKYKTLEIGEQVWMAENLNYETSGGSWVYRNDTSNASTYGRLYDWETACEVCPDGWHLPSDAEWTQLEEYLIANGYNYDGSLLGNKIGKSLASKIGWSNSEQIGDIGNESLSNDSTGFSVYPGGYRNLGINFYTMGSSAHFWSSSELSSNLAWFRRLDYNFNGLLRFDINKGYGYSVRCIMD